MPYQSHIHRLVFESLVTSLIQVILRFFTFGFHFWIDICVQPEFSPVKNWKQFWDEGPLKLQSDNFILAASCQSMMASHRGVLFLQGHFFDFLLFYGLRIRLSRQRTFHRPHTVDNIDWVVVSRS